MQNKKPIDINKRGMILEVDLDYPQKTHTPHKDFPLAQERYNVTYNELSPVNHFCIKNWEPKKYLL